MNSGPGPDRLQYDPSHKAVIDNPFPLFRRLRLEAPVHWSDTLRGWVVTRFDDCKQVTMDKRFSAERMRAFFEALDPHDRRKVANLECSVGLWAVFLDPPDHTRLRGLLNRGFTSRAVTGMESDIAKIVTDCVSPLPDQGEIDFIQDIAYRIPATVIMNMLGVPLSEVEKFKIWSDDIGLFVGGAKVTADKYARAEAATAEMSAVFRDLIQDRRKSPRDDMLSSLAEARDDDGMLSEEELIATCILLLFAGHETTANLLGNGMYHFLKNPEQWDLLRDNPRLAANAIEEILRFDGPSGAVVRVALEPVELGGQTIAAGQRVFAMVNAANRDADIFTDAETFNISRAAGPHLTFGHGLHFCLGAPLARLEGRIAFPIFAEKFAPMALLGPEPEWLDSVTFRGLTSLPMQYGRS